MSQRERERKQSYPQGVTATLRVISKLLPATATAESERGTERAICDASVRFGVEDEAKRQEIIRAMPETVTKKKGKGKMIERQKRKRK